MKRYINSFGTRKNCHKNGKNPLLFQFIREAIEWTVIIIEEFHSCLLNIKFSQKYFYKKWFRVQMSSKYHVFASMGRFQLELIYLFFSTSIHLRTVENEGKLIL